MRGSVNPRSACCLQRSISRMDCKLMMKMILILTKKWGMKLTVLGFKNWLHIQAKAFRSHEEDDSDDDFSDDDEEMQSPLDEVDPFIFFVETIKAMHASDPSRFQSLTQTLDFRYQALANGADHRRVEIEKVKTEKASVAS